MEKAEGKWASSLGKAILIDDSYIVPFLISAFTDNIRSLLRKYGCNIYMIDRENPIIRIMAELLMLGLEKLKLVKIEEYALLSEIVLKDRTDFYLKGMQQRDKDSRQYMRQLAANVFGLGYRAQYTAPLLAAVDSMDSFIILLDVAFLTVTFFLTLLSILLIYSLMMSVCIECLHFYRTLMRRRMSTVC